MYVRKWPLAIAGVLVAGATMFLDKKVSGVDWPGIVNSILSIVAAGLAFHQFREENKIEAELSKLQAGVVPEYFHGIKKDALNRRLEAKRRRLQNQRFSMVIYIVVLVVTAESIGLYSAIFS